MKLNLAHALQTILGLNRIQDSPAAFRNRRLRYAAITSLVSKVVTFSLQVLAMPVAVRTLGTEQFALYAMINSAVAWINLANFGIGPGLTVGIASAAAQGDTRREKELFTSAFLSVLLLVLAVGAVLFLALSQIPIEVLLSAQYRNYYPTARTSIYLLVFFILAYGLSTVIESTQAGYQESYIYNAWLICGNVITIVALLLMPLLKPTLVTMILAVSGPALLARLANTIFFLFQHKLLRIRLRYYSFSQAKTLLASGFAYSFTAVGNFLNHQVPIVLIGRQLSATSTATFTAVMTFYNLSFGMMTTLTMPALPALSDSKARSDGSWAKKAYRNIVIYGMLYAIIVGLAMSFLGVPILRLWFGPSVDPYPALVLGLGIYMVLSSWEYLHQMILVGLDRIRISSFLYGVRSLLTPVLVPVVIVSHGTVAVMVVLSVGVLAVTAWSLPLLTRASLRNIDRAPLERMSA